MLRGEWGDQLLFSCGRNLVIGESRHITSYHYVVSSHVWLYYYESGLEVRDSGDQWDAIP